MDDPERRKKAASASVRDAVNWFVVNWLLLLVLAGIERLRLFLTSRVAIDVCCAASGDH